MNWVIIILLLLSVVGSMLWMQPSPRQKMQAVLRQQAMRKGIQVQLSRLLFPRAIGEALADERDCIAYRLPRTNRQNRNRLRVPWLIFKINSHATTGLPEGWCWSKGEGQLEPRQLEQIGQLIDRLPEGSYALESTPVAVSLYWHESGGEQVVEEIHGTLQSMLEQDI